MPHHHSRSPAQRGQLCAAQDQKESGYNFLLWFEKLFDQEKDYLTNSLPSGVLHLAWQGGGDNRRRNSLYLTGEEERGTRRYVSLSTFLICPIIIQFSPTSPLSPSHPAFCVISFYLCRNVFERLICNFRRAELSTQRGRERQRDKRRQMGR